MEDQEELSPNNSGDEMMVSGVPVGITIAYNRKQKGLKETISSKSSTKKPRRQPPNQEEGSPQKKKKVRSESFQMFLEGSVIYALCLILPTMIGYMYNSYDVWKYEQEQQQQQVNVTTATGYSADMIQWLSTTYYDPTVDYVCAGTATNAASESSSAWYLVSSLIDWTGVCAVDEAIEDKSLLSEDVTAWSDLSIVVVSSLFLALVRIFIVHYAVPMESIAEAMVRCKSIHLLSSEYVVTPTATPRTSSSSRQVRTIQPDDAQMMMMPDLGTGSLQPSNFEDDMFGVNIDGEEDVLLSNNSVLNMNTFATGQPDQSSELPEQPAADEPISFGSRKYAAPRLATALFRLLYSLLAVFIALYYFRDADFWPWYVFGHGNTAKCWDLSGGLTVGMDSDFDHHNTVLKRYFLLQASYHWHSGAFHVLSMLVLLFHPTTDNRFLTLQKSTSNYVRRLAQHGLAVALIAVAYVFSSLRRLGAIGLFAFDLSSSFLHLLQVCINTPEGSRLRQKAIVSRVFWLLVVPSFAVTRFLIWPAMWYSATFESVFWLTQLEKTLWPGSAALLRGIFHFLMIVMQSFTVVYFRRLLNHPHLQGLRKRVKKE